MDFPGTLIGIVGPSGAGKDSLLAAARERFSGDGRVVFAQRFITRPADDGTERHHPVSRAEFAHMRFNGAFALDWHAHGLDYGIPAAIEDALGAGTSVVANLSRGVLDTVRARYNNCTIVAVSVDPACLRERLIARGRETAQEIEKRLSRVDFAVPSGDDVVHIDNSGALEAAAETFRAVIAATLARQTQDALS